MSLEQEAAKKVFFDWEKNIVLNKEDIIKRQTELNAYNLLKDKSKFQIPKCS